MARLALISLLLACSTSVNAAVLNTRQSDSNTTASVVVTLKDADQAGRKKEVAYRHDNFLYNVSLIGNAAAFPMGTIGEQRVALAWDQWQIDRNIITADIQKDVAQIREAIVAVSVVQYRGFATHTNTSIRTTGPFRRWMIMQRSCTKASGSTRHRSSLLLVPLLITLLTHFSAASVWFVLTRSTRRLTRTLNLSTLPRMRRRRLLGQQLQNCLKRVVSLLWIVRTLVSQARIVLTMRR